jgi:hypothetical protein
MDDDFSFVGLRNFNVPKRKYSCCIRIVREGYVVIGVIGYTGRAIAESDLGPFLYRGPTAGHNVQGFVADSAAVP